MRGSAQFSVSKEAPPAQPRRARAARSTAERRDAEALPPEIGFLAAHGVAPGILREAAALAQQAGVTADAALLGEGLLDQQTFYRCLARHLGVAYLDTPLAVEGAGDPAAVVDAGIARLAPNARGLSHVLAPRGASLRWLLASPLRRREPKPAIAIATPRLFGSLVRGAQRQRIADAASDGLRRSDGSLSARSGMTNGQAAWAIVAAALSGAAIGWYPAAGFIAGLFCGLLFLVAILTKLFAIAASPPPLPRGARRRAPTHALPVYSIIVPLYREARVARKIVAALDALDYPRCKLDIKLVVEERDRETIAALVALRLPARYEIVVAPPGFPRTKPRALNVALPFARGELITVYDAEDEPDPGQLRAAAARFAGAAPAVACLQAKLAIDNTGDNWLARLFTIEYSALFDVLNPGLAALGLPILLGGTSNHFRTAILRDVGGWDAWNVTEDADLGIRLARRGLVVETLDSTTHEEAPADPLRWLGQRRRWLKGWMRTLTVHTRRPDWLFAELGAVRAAATLALMASTVLAALFMPLFAILGGLSIESAMLHPATDLEVAECVLGCVVFLAGLGGALWASLLGLKRRRWLNLCSSLLLLPAYYGLLTVAGWWAFAELCCDPHFWAKTEHGIAKTSRRQAGDGNHADAATRPLSGLAGSQA